jgi:glycosyltransferase involved in cell wall biosynthesis
MTTNESLDNIIWRFRGFENRTREWLERRRIRRILEKTRAKQTEHTDLNPLISVIIPTYNRGKILTERTIPSVLSQTYHNFEVIIVGDHCTDDTEQLLGGINDKRIRYINLSKRGKYPQDPWFRWLVAGSVPRNTGLKLAKGEWIAPFDDDDEFSHDHLESLLNFALEKDYELVYGAVEMQNEEGKWAKCGSTPLRKDNICHMSILYHSKLKLLKYNPASWKIREPDDWNLWRRMQEAGVKIGFLDRIVGKHHREFTRYNL